MVRLLKTPVFTTREYAALNGVSLPAASKRLATMSRQGHIEPLTRGIWVIPDHPHFSLYGCVPALLGKEDGYVTFLSALHLHDVISQIPKAIQVATTGHPRKLDTRFGRFEFFKLHPRMMGSGVEWQEVALPFRMAGVEKALLDTFYIATRRGRRFAKLPELELTRSFRKREFEKLVREQIPFPQIRQAVMLRFQNLGSPT